MTEKSQEQLEQERRAEQEEAERAFNVGFGVAPQDNPPAKPDGDGDGSGEEPSQSAETGAEDPEAGGGEDPAAETAPDPLAAINEKLEAMSRRLEQVDGNARAASGRADRLQAALQKGQAASDRAGADAPSGRQISDALKNPKAWEQLEEDFPDFTGPVKAELMAIRQDLASRGHAQVDVEAIARQAAEHATKVVREETVEDEHPGWRQEVATPEFGKWLNAQDEQTRALASSVRPRDAIKLLDGWKKYKQKSVETAASNKRRLEAAMSPQGTQVKPRAGISDDEAFVRGFNSG